MIDHESALSAYGRAWSRSEEADIRAELEHCWTGESTHISPLSGAVRGLDGLVSLILDFPVMFPGAQMFFTAGAGIQHDKTYLTWRLTSTTRIRMMGHDHGLSVDSVDFVEFAPSGTIRSVTSFFGAHNPATMILPEDILHLDTTVAEPAHR